MKPHLYFKKLIVILALVTSGADAWAQAGEALNFDGVDNYIDAGNPAALSTANFKTMEVKVMFNTFAVDQEIVGKASGPQGITLDIFNGSLNAWYMNGSVYSYISWPVSNLSTGQFYHIATTWDGATKESIRLYVNGVSVGTRTDAGDLNTGGPSNPAVSFKIGNWTQPGTNVERYLNGTVDEVRVWGRMLCQPEIVNNMNCELPSPTNQAGLLLYYQFNQGQAGQANTDAIAADASGNNRTGTLNGFTLSGATSNWAAPGGVTTGVSCTAYQAPEAFTTCPASIITANTNTANCTATVTYTTQTAGAATLSYAFAGVTTGSGSGDGSGSSFNKGTTFVTVTATNSCGATATCSFSVAVSDMTAPSITCAGPVTINNTPGLCTGTTTLTTPGVTDNCPLNMGNGLNFDGANDFVVTNGLVNLGTTYTWECWFKTTAANGAYASLISATDNPAIAGTGGGAVAQLNFDVNGKLRATDGPIVNGNTYVNDNKWHHAALVVSGASALLYIDGALDGSGGSNQVPVNRKLVLGAEHYLSVYAHVVLDEVRIWTTARTQSEIRAAMYGALALPQTGLAAYYKFDQGIIDGTNTGLVSLSDETSNHSDATLANFANTGTSSNWTTGVIFPVTNDAPFAYPIGNTTVTWTARDASGIEATCTQVVTVNAPEVNVQSNSTDIIAGSGTTATANNTDLGSTAVNAPITQTYTIQNTGTAGLTVSKFKFSGTNAAMFTRGTLTPASPIAAGASATFTITFTPTSVGQKTAILTITNTDCDEDTYVFSLTGAGTCTTPTAYNLTGGGSYCTGTSGLVIGLDGSQTGITYQLYNGAATVGSPVAGTGNAISFGTAAYATGTYSVVATNTAGDCTTPMTNTVTVDTYPNASATISGTATICAGTATDINFSGTAGATVTYDAGTTTGATAILDASGGKAINVHPLTSTGYTITSVTSTDGCISNITGQSATVTVRDLPAVTSVSAPSTVCNGNAVTVTYAATPNTSVSFNYNISNQNVTTAGNGTGSFSNTPSIGTTTYSATAIQYNTVPACPTAVTGQSATVNAIQPNATLSGTTTICRNSTTTLSFSGTPNATITYNAGSTPQSVLLDGSGAATVTVTPTATTTYTATGASITTPIACTGTASGTAVVTVNPLPAATVSATATTCPAGSNGSITFGTPTAGTAAFSYSINGGTNYQSSNTFSNLSAGTGYVAVIKDGNNCVATAQAVTVPAGVDNTAPKFFQQGPTPTPAAILTNVPEATSYNLVYALDIPASGANYVANGVTYAVNNAAALAGTSFARVAYYMQIDTKWVWVSMNKFTSTTSKLGIPLGDANVFQQTVTGMNILTNVPGITTGTNINTGNIEFWDDCYSMTNGLGLPNANTATYDFDDTRATSHCYGSFQVHNYGARQTLFAFNDWSLGIVCDLGIGNNDGTTSGASQGRSNPDWTFMANANLYTTRKLYVFIDAGLSNITANTDAGQCQATIAITTPTATDNCAASPAVSGVRSDALALSAPYPKGTTTITWTANDGYQTATATQRVIVTDAELPTISAPTTVTTTVDASHCTAVVSNLGTPTAADNCPGVTYASNAPVNNTYNIGTTTVTWTATDAAGNQRTATQSVIVQAPEIDLTDGATHPIADGTATTSTGTHTDFGPVATGVPSAWTYTIANSGNATLTITGITKDVATGSTDFAIGTPSATTIPAGGTATFSITFTPSAIGPRGTTIHIANDDCNETAYDFAVKGVGSCTTPTAFAVSGGGSYCSGTSGLAIGLAGSQTGINYQLYNGPSTVGSAVAGSGNAISFGTATYAAGNYTVVATNTVGSCTNNMTGSATVTVNTPPSFTATNSNQAANTGAGTCAAVVSYTTLPVATGSPAPTLAYAFTNATTGSASGTGSGSTFNRGVTNVVVTASNGCTQTATNSFTITVTDNIAPTITCGPTATASTSPGQCTANVTVVAPTVTDNCTLASGPGPELVINGDFNNADVNWIACGNSAEAYGSEPSYGGSNASNKVAEIDPGGGPTTADDQTLCQTITGFTIGNTYVLTFKASRRTGAPATVGANVTINGGALSQVVTRANSAFAFTQESFTFTATQTTHQLTFTPSSQWGTTTGFIVDDVSIKEQRNAFTNSINGTGDASGTYPIGTTSITWTATDAAGNHNTCTQNVVVTDNEAPVVHCPGNVAVNIVPNTCAGNYTILAPVSDNCTQNTIWGASFSGNANGNPSAITGIAYSGNSNVISFSKGVTTVTLNGTDGTNAAAGCTFTVTVNDNQLPTLACPGDQSINTNNGLCTGSYTIASPVSDNCPGSTWGYILSGATTTTVSGINAGISSSILAFNFGETMVQLSGKDATGNIATSCSFKVTVNDNQDPVFTSLPLPTVTLSGYCQPTAAALAVPATSDNCSVQSTVARVGGIVIDPQTYPFPNGTTTTVSWTVTDVHGRTASTTQNVIITSATVNAPVSVLPAYTLPGQEIQTIYLGYPSAVQTEAITVTPTGGTNSYTYQWKKSSCNGDATTLADLSGTTSSYTYAPGMQDVCNGNEDNVFIFSVKVTDSHGCNATTTKKVNVVNPFTDAAHLNVQLCHKVAVRGGSVTQSMVVPQSQVASHLSHGDILGNCVTFMAVKSNPAETVLEEQHAAVYPNPTTGIFILELTEVRERADILVTDIQGKVVATKTLKKEDVPTATFDLGNLARGMYLIQVKDGDFSYRTKIVLQ